MAFVSLLTSSPLTKIGIICQVLQEEKIFPIMLRSEWLARWSLKCPQKCSEIWWKSGSKIACNYTWLLHGKICRTVSWWCLLTIFWTGSKPNRKSITAAKKQEKGKAQKLWYLYMPSKNVVKCGATVVKREVCCHVANAFLSGLELIWPISTGLKVYFWLWEHLCDQV